MEGALPPLRPLGLWERLSLLDALGGKDRGPPGEAVGRWPPNRRAGLGAGPRGQIQVQQSVEQSSLAGGPAFPAFLLTLGSSRKKDMARAQW